MAKGKNFLKAFIPPIIFSLLKKSRKNNSEQEIWSGNYATWSEAQKNCTGYTSDAILDKCKNALLKVKNGEVAYERDSVLFDKIQYSWGLLSGLQRAALENNGKLCVLDFGGSLGSTYYQNKEFLSGLKEIQWCIVEQKHFVDCGKKNFENDQLKFYYTIEECLDKNKPTILLLSSVLQYIENPDELLAKIIKLDIPYLLLDRLALSDEKQDILTIQNVSKDFYESKLGHWFFSFDKLLEKLNTRYKLLASTPSFSEENFILNKNIKCYFNLLFFKKK